MRIRVKACRKIPWIAMALQIKTRLWLGGVVSEHRNRHLADALFHLVKQCCLPLQELLVVTDGWAAYPKSIRRVCARKSSEPRSTRTVSASGMARFAHRHGYQTDRAQACSRSGSSDGGIGLEERALQLLASTERAAIF